MFPVMPVVTSVPVVRPVVIMPVFIGMVVMRMIVVADAETWVVMTIIMIMPKWNTKADTDAEITGPDMLRGKTGEQDRGSGQQNKLGETFAFHSTHLAQRVSTR